MPNFRVYVDSVIVIEAENAEEAMQRTINEIDDCAKRNCGDIAGEIMASAQIEKITEDINE